MSGALFWPLFGIGCAADLFVLYVYARLALAPHADPEWEQ